ncbi:phosphoenolpyruvate phosphomutase [Salinisphaera hydrothermalis C41B8]|uniref:phosphoenolpyruvate mutase n=1 Tax=Salinisphaera hydrothermalis (strain C41B8) TaxID=1304275 RepID=A0A084IK59_SALHC|nr:phosphoenolpyruvate mutase [Salinisphaera hydrothermalis]KEZ77093.1 phosphoenolpyruvate phosphomutase [Salinisphaera hydrothermalis C41B8]
MLADIKARTTPNKTKTRALRDLLESNRLEFIMEAHNGLSARIVEEAGFAGIWASGLALSAAFGVRDSNEASWTQVLETVEFMADATDVPILLDGDTGYGNFNNLRRLVNKLESRGVAGVCIEDKLFPKTNSFIDGERQPLADVDEFCGKIRAGKDAQADPDFCIVARVEALIAGWSVDEALERAKAYQQAGADAILIHDKAPRFDNIQKFADRWDGSCPLVIVPTKYYSTPTDVFRAAGISLVIWANHTVRASVTAMQNTVARIYQNETLTGVEDRIAPVSEIFRLQGDPELREAEKRYAGDAGAATRAIVLAAARGEGLEPVTEARPKAMLEVAGKPLLRHLVDVFKQHGLHDITAVAGYRPETIDVAGVKVVENPDFETTGELASLDKAREHFGDDNLIVYGDLIFRRHVLTDLLEAPGEITVVVDSQGRRSDAPQRDPAWCSAPDDRSLFGQSVALTHVGMDNAPDSTPNGRWIGVMRSRGEGRVWIRQALDKLRAEGRFETAGVPDLLNELIAAGHRVDVIYITGHWLDVNDLDDLRAASEFAHGEAAS